jgi:hypothetical protein
MRLRRLVGFQPSVSIQQQQPVSVKRLNYFKDVGVTSSSQNLFRFGMPFIGVGCRDLGAESHALLAISSRLDTSVCNI